MNTNDIGKKNIDPYFIPKDIQASIEKLEKLRDQMTVNTSNTRSKLKKIRNIILSLNKLFKDIKLNSKNQIMIPKSYLSND